MDSSYSGLSTLAEEGMGSMGKRKSTATYRDLLPQRTSRSAFDRPVHGGNPGCPLARVVTATVKVLRGGWVVCERQVEHGTRNS